MAGNARRPAAAALARETVAALRRKGTARRARAADWYYPTRMRVLGVTVPEMRVVLRDLRRRLRDAPPEEVLRVARALVETDVMEATGVGYALLAPREDALRLLRARDVEALGRNLDNWATVDGFSDCVTGRAWRLGVLSDAFFRRWSRSEDRWYRRAALVATVGLNHRAWGGTGDAPRTLVLCDALVDDRDDMVVKAMSWALRALSGPHPEAVRAFLARHGDRVAPRARREVVSKMTTGLKNPRRAGRRPS